MKIHEIDQRSDEWHELRRGKMTASNAQCIGTNGTGLETYIYGILAEKYSNNKDSYMSADMQRGVDLEDSARMTYGFEHFEHPIKEVGFVEMDEFVGCSPDGLVGEVGGLEIKCPNDTNYFKLLVNGEKAIDAKYLWQVQMCLMITGREWWDLVFYNPNFDQNLLTFRITPDRAKREKLMMGITRGKTLINELTRKYENRS